MMTPIKQRLRDLLPLQFQVPVKYRWNQLRGWLEPEMDLLPYLAPRGGRALDVGGNLGVYAYPLYRLGAQVEVFEPNPACQRVLEAWAAGLERVHVHPVGLSRAPGIAVLHIPVDARGTTHSAAASLEAGANGRETELTVELKTLDAFAFPEIDLLKVDVEGHEMGVLEGGAESISRCRPAILIEIERRHRAAPIEPVFEHIQVLDYQGHFLIGEKLVNISRFEPDLHQVPGISKPYINNFLFLPEERVADGRYVDLFARFPA
jgi:FkbM family methyltransferase